MELLWVFLSAVNGVTIGTILYKLTQGGIKGLDANDKIIGVFSVLAMGVIFLGVWSD